MDSDKPDFFPAVFRVFLINVYPEFSIWPANCIHFGRLYPDSVYGNESSLFHKRFFQVGQARAGIFWIDAITKIAREELIHLYKFGPAFWSLPPNNS